MKLLHEVLTLDRPLLGFDLETTGTNDKYDRIVELAIEIMMPGKPVKEYRTLVNPQMPIPPGATAVHGITDEMVADAPTFAQLADNLLIGFVGCDFAGYNVRFDLKMIAAEFARAKKTWDYATARVIDGFRLWQVIEGRSLEHAIEHWLPRDADESVEGKAHNALWDVKMSTRVIAAQLAKHADTLTLDLDKLHELCAPGWYDHEGKLQWRDGELCFSFGEHKSKSLRVVPAGYLKWVLRADFSEKVKEACRMALDGKYPTPPAVPVEE